MTYFSISPSLRKVFPKVRIWVAQELMRSQKPDANKDPMDPLVQVAILGNHLYVLCSLWLCEFVINMYEVHIIFVIKENHDVFGSLKLWVPPPAEDVPAEALWSISVAYHCWLFCHWCACAGCYSTIQAVWGSPCTDCILLFSILLLALGMIFTQITKHIYYILQ